MKHHLELKKLEKFGAAFLENIYVESEFIDPIIEIIDRIKDKKETTSQPFIMMDVGEIVSFFTIESANPNVEKNNATDGVYWLESFFITKSYLGKGYSESVVREMLQNLHLHIPTISLLKMTVNFRNEVAQYIYKKCGIKDTGEKYLGGPAGPQYIYKITIN